MKADMFTIEGKKTGSVDLPMQCHEEYRPDMIHRAFLAYQSHNRQPYGAYAKAGERQSAKLSRRRRDFKTSYGHGISRVPRKSLWHRGRQFGWVGAVAPGTVGGRRAHPPKSKKIFDQKINKKERRKAIRSALAATFSEQLVKQRGHKIEFLPSVIESKMESISKTKDVEQMLQNLKLHGELARISVVKVRAGKGKMRNRKYKTKKGPLLVVSKPCALQKAAENMIGVDIALVTDLNVNLLAPGGLPGRLTLYSEDAIKRLTNEKLFLGIPKKKEPKPVKEVKQEKKPEQKKVEIKKPTPKTQEKSAPKAAAKPAAKQTAGKKK